MEQLYQQASVAENGANSSYVLLTSSAAALRHLRNCRLLITIRLPVGLPQTAARTNARADSA
jgi:hypothetical protein